MSDFVIRPFAFMRLTHEALRAGFASLRRAADAGDLDQAQRVWEDLAGIVALHKRHEEEVFFPMLDEAFDDAVREAGLRTAHEDEAQHEAAVEAALEAGAADALREALEAWSGPFERHLAEEEAVMMPLTQQVAPTMEGRAAAVRTILDVDWEALSTIHVPRVVRSLSETKPYGPVRMFVAALQASAGERFGELEGVIRGALPADTVQALTKHGHLSPAA